MLLRIVSVTALILVLVGCAGQSTHRTLAVDSTPVTFTVDATTTHPDRIIVSDLPGIEELEGRWGARYAIHVPSLPEPMVFEILPDGDGDGEDETVRILPTDYGIFPITAKTNPSRTIITYQGEGGKRYRFCSLKGVQAFMNNDITGFGMNVPKCQFEKVFLRP
ncbi:MAG: hypothetical protein HYT15_01975 [Candidatus Magasanikbacteria bacterium]|nr:hypothetical protein [Candidatus Magasanikbacteria bacterium]